MCTWRGWFNCVNLIYIIHTKRFSKSEKWRTMSKDLWSIDSFPCTIFLLLYIHVIHILSKGSVSFYLFFLMRDYANSTILLVTLFARNVPPIFRGVISAQFRLVISAGNGSAYVQVHRVLRWLESFRETSPYYSRRVEFDSLFWWTYIPQMLMKYTVDIY